MFLISIYEFCLRADFSVLRLCCDGCFVCKVCFTDKQGSECMKFNKCNHVFCNECMKGYFESQISSGNIKSLTCPQDKCDSHALQTQVIFSQYFK